MAKSAQGKDQKETNGTKPGNEPNKSDEIRSLLKANPKAPAKEIQDALAKKDIKVTSSLIYFIKGQIQGKKGPAARPKAAANGTATKSEGKPEATKPEASKSEEIRKLLMANPSMSAGEVQTVLAKQGISVTGGLIYFVKGKMKGTKQRQGAKAKTAAVAKTGSTQKTDTQGSEVNKSNEVRELLAQNPKAPAKEIQETLAKRGINVSGNLIYLLKSKAGAKRRRQKREKVAQVVSTSGHGDPVVTIRKVKALASDVGGMKKLTALLEALSE